MKDREMNKTLAIIVLIGAMSLGACTNDPGMNGAMIGAAGGATAGQLIGGDGESTVIGGALGALAGGAIGSTRRPRY